MAKVVILTTDGLAVKRDIYGEIYRRTMERLERGGDVDFGVALADALKEFEAEVEAYAKSLPDLPKPEKR